MPARKYIELTNLDEKRAAKFLNSIITVKLPVELTCSLDIFLSLGLIESKSDGIRIAVHLFIYQMETDVEFKKRMLAIIERTSNLTKHDDDGRPYHDYHAELEGNDDYKDFGQLFLYINDKFNIKFNNDMREIVTSFKLSNVYLNELQVFSKESSKIVVSYPHGIERKSISHKQTENISLVIRLAVMEYIIKEFQRIKNFEEQESKK